MSETANAAHLLTRKSHRRRKADGVRFIEELSLERTRVHEVCGLARRRLALCPLGSAALAGTGFPIDREMTAQALGFDGPTHNSLDAVSDRDFALDYLMAASQCSLHLSRLAEELII